MVGVSNLVLDFGIFVYIMRYLGDGTSQTQNSFTFHRYPFHIMNFIQCFSVSVPHHVRGRVKFSICSSVMLALKNFSFGGLERRFCR